MNPVKWRLEVLIFTLAILATGFVVSIGLIGALLVGAGVLTP